MKTILALLAVALAAVLIIVALSDAQTLNTTGAPVMKITSTTGAVTFVSFDTLACRARGVAASGLKYTQAQLDSAKATVTGCTPADSVRWVNQGINTPFQYLIVQTPNGRRDSLVRVGP